MTMSTGRRMRHHIGRFFFAALPPGCLGPPGPFGPPGPPEPVVSAEPASAPASCPSEAEAAPAADRDSAVSSEYSENRCGAGQNEVSASAVLSPSASSPEPPPSPVPEEPSLSAASPPAGVGAANGAVDGWAAAAERSEERRV